MARVCIRRTAEEKTALIKQWKESGLSILKWCRENKISEPTFRGWVIPKVKKSTAVSNSSNFIELKDARDNNVDIKIKYSGATIYLPEGFNVEELRKCIEALKVCKC